MALAARGLQRRLLPCDLHGHNGFVRFAVLFVLSLFVVMPATAQVPGTRAADLAREAWHALDGGHAAAAAAAFDEALTLERRDPALFLGAALAAHLQGQSGRARPLLEQALQIHADYVPAAMLLGEVCYRLGDLDAAIRTYEELLARVPGQPAVRARLASWRKDASVHRDFFQQPGAHFTILFEGPGEEPLAARALEILENGYWRIGTALGVFPADPITVVLYTQEQFRDITRSPDWAAALYDGRIRVPMRGALDNPSELERVLTHELTHALVQSIAPRHVPTWLNEGLAVCFEPEGRTWAESQLARTPAGHALAGTFEKLDARDARLAYASSAVAVQRMIDLAGATAVVSLLGDLAEGIPLETAFERRLLMSYADFQAGLSGAR